MMNNKRVPLANTFRECFPFFTQYPDWTYLDSAATTLKPEILSQATHQFYCSAGSVHRSQYDFTQSQEYELARDLVRERFNIECREAVVWTSGTTHSINLIANGLAETIQAGDEIIISVAEHHANFVPWQQLALQKSAKLIVLPVNEVYQIAVDGLQSVLSDKTKVVALNVVSNVTGVRQPIEQLIPIIRQYSLASIVLDCAQAVSSELLDFQALDADFYAFSAHKMYGPTGVGVLTGKLASLAKLRPLFFGGKMLQTVGESYLTLADLPYRLEAGTPNIAGIIGFGQVLQWLKQWDYRQLNRELYDLVANTHKQLANYPDIQLFSTANASPIISFNLAHHHADLAAIFTEQHIALRSGEHCAQPYIRFLQQSGTLRLSLAYYNTAQDIERFFAGLDMALTLLAE